MKALAGATLRAFGVIWLVVVLAFYAIPAFALPTPTRVTDPLSHATLSTYDARSRLTDITDPDGNATRFSFDAQDNLTSRKKGSGTEVSPQISSINQHVAR